MNVEDPNDPKFDTIRRALALKRHETPPPRYFNELPGKIRARLAEADASEPVSLFEKIRQAFVLRPMMATGAGMVAGVFVLGATALVLLPSGDAVPDHSVTATQPTVFSDPSVTTLEHTRLPAGLGNLAEAPTNSPAEDSKGLFDSFKPQTAPVVAPIQPK